MTYDKQDLLLDLRKTRIRLERAATDHEEAHMAADAALLKFIDDEHVTEAFQAIPKWYA